MILRATDGIRGKIFDLDTGREVKGVLWLDTDTGMLETQDGTEMVGNFRFVPRQKPKYAPNARKVVMGAPKCVRCSSPLTLPGKDLCASCNAADKGQRNRMLVERLASPILDRKCERCSRAAVIAVSDEVETTPEKVGRRLFDRGATVGRRFYCQQHYLSPRLLDAKGEVIAELEDSTGPELTRSIA